MLSRDDLHNYQHRFIDFVKSSQRVMGAIAMGMGKTTSTLTAASDLLDSFAVQRVLVIAPLRVARSVWKQEAAQWDHLSHLQFSVVVGSEKERLAALQRRADIYVINRENVAWLTKRYGTRWPFDMVVVDESSSFKSASSQRFKAMKRVLPAIKYIVLLTGTPSPNGLLDLWSQAYMLDFGAALGRTAGDYQRRFFVQGYGGYSYTPMVGAQAKIEKLLRPMVMSLAAEDYLEVPTRIDLMQQVVLPAAAAKEYAAFEKSMFIELPDGADVEAQSAAILANKLLQYANGALYTDKSGAWSEVHAAKLDALEELIEENPGETMLVGYNFKSDLARLQARFPQARVLDNDPETILAWNRKEIPLLLAHPQSAGHGLNLQAGGSLMVWFGLCWSLEYYQQMNARLHRQGQTEPVRVVHLVAEGTIDARVVAVLTAKDVVQRSLLDALKP
jgi:SNF2 family DNA or RNA helicase